MRLRALDLQASAGLLYHPILATLDTNDLPQLDIEARMNAGFPSGR